MVPWEGNMEQTRERKGLEFRELLESYKIQRRQCLSFQLYMSLQVIYEICTIAVKGITIKKCIQQLYNENVLRWNEKQK